jgi:YbbR domain-containing protein
MIRKWLLNNLRLKLTSLAMAILSWFYLTGIINIERDIATRVMDNVGVKLLRESGKPLGNNLEIEVIPDRVSVTLKGRKSILKEIELSGLTLFIDIANFDVPGRYENIPLQIVAPPGIEAVPHPHYCEVIIKEREKASKSRSPRTPVR